MRSCARPWRPTEVRRRSREQEQDQAWCEAMIRVPRRRARGESDIAQHGYTPGCKGAALRLGKPPQGHTDVL